MLCSFSETKQTGGGIVLFILCQGSAVLFGLETLDCPEFPLHRSEKAMLLLALNGMPQILENGQLYQAHPGDLLLLSPGASRALCGGGRVLLVFFDPCMTGICASDLRTLLPRSPLFPSEIVPQDVRALLPLLPAVREERALRGYLQAICARLLSATETVSRPAWKELDWPERATDYLSAHFTDPVSLGVLADAVGMSKYHLSRSFPERIGCGLNDYLQILRTARAQLLLLGTNLSPAEIAAESGFDSAATFYRVFRARCGTSPLLFRERYASN